MLDANVGNLVEQLLGLLGILVNPLLALGKQLRPAALNHVAEERPGGTAEANQGYPPGQLLPGEGDGLVHIVELVGDLDIALHNLAVLRVIGALEWARKVRALLIHHLDVHAHGLGDDEDVREDDGGIEEASVALDGLEGDGGCDFGVAAALKEVAVALGLMVFREISAGCIGSRFRLRNDCMGELGHSHLVASPTWAGVRRLDLFHGAPSQQSS